MIAPVMPLPQVVRFTPGPMITVRGLLHQQDHWIRQFLTVRNGRRERAMRYGDTQEPEWLVGYADGANGDLLIAPGALQGVMRGLRAEWPGTHCVPDGAWSQYAYVDIPYNRDPSALQAAAMMAVRNLPRGLIVGPCGSGKGDMIIQAVKHHAMPGLIIVDTDVNREELKKRVIETTGIKPWIFGRGRKERHENPFCIATYQGLRANLPAVQRLAQSRGTVIVDEAHVMPVSGFLDVLRYLPAARRYGFTATPDREDGLTPLMYWWIGPEISRIERDDVEESGAVMRPEMIILTTEFEATYDPSDERDEKRLNDAMYMDRGRLELITGDIIARMKTRYAGLVNCNSIRYGDMIQGELIRRGFPAAQVRCVTSQTKKKERRETYAAVAKGDVRVLIATSLAEKALDIPPLDTCWMATPLNSAVKTEQKWGRVCRGRVPGKLQPLIIEIVDPFVTRVAEDGRIIRKFVNQFRARMRAYRKKADYSSADVAAVLKGDALVNTRIA